MIDKKTLLAILTLSLFPIYAQKISTDKYRLVWNDDPATTMTIIWNQIMGGEQKLHYSATSPSDCASLDEWLKESVACVPDRQSSYRGMNNNFVRLKNLCPNTAYYFAVKDTCKISPVMWFKTAPNVPCPITCIIGGDTKSPKKAVSYRAGLASNKMVAKLRPLFVVFTGDFCSGHGTDDFRWQVWLDDWYNLTRTSDGQMFPLLPVHGNHENADYHVLHELFDAGADNDLDYYALSFAGDLLRVIVLNTELRNIEGAFAAQRKWLRQELSSSQQHTFRVACYHKPIRPHTARKRENDYLYHAWAQMFYNYKLNLAFEADSHMHKITYPLRPSEEDGSHEGFIRDDNNGTMYVGEGSWGARARSNDDDKPWTLGSAQIQQFKWLHIFPTRENQPAHIDIYTVITGIYREGELVSQVKNVGSNSEQDVFAMPEKIELFSNGNCGKVVRYPFVGKVK